MGKPSPKYRRYYSGHTIRSRTGGRHLKKTEYADWKQKKMPGRQPKIKDKTLLEFMEAKTKEVQHIAPENIARDLKNELGVDYSLSGIHNAMHRLNYTCQDCGTPASNGYVSEFLVPCGELTPL